MNCRKSIFLIPLLLMLVILVVYSKEPLPYYPVSHYAESVKVSFTGCTLEEYEKVLRDFLKKRHPNLDLDSIEGKNLVRGMALMVKDSKGGTPCLVGKYYNRVIDGYNSYIELEEIINSHRLPLRYKELLCNFYGETLITKGLRIDCEELRALLSSIPVESRMVEIPVGNKLDQILPKVDPFFSDLNPYDKKNIYDYISLLNPWFKLRGWYCTEENVNEIMDNVVITDGNRKYVFLYELENFREILIPSSTFIKEKILKGEKFVLNEHLKVHVEAGGRRNEEILVLTLHDSDGVISFCDLACIYLKLSASRSVIEYGYGETPVIGCLTYEADVKGLKLKNSGIEGKLILYMHKNDWNKIFKCEYNLAVEFSADRAKGRYKCVIEPSQQERNLKSLAVISEGTIDGRFISYGSSARSFAALPQDTGWPNWRGRNCDGAGDYQTTNLISSPLQMRLVWRSTDILPDSKPSWPIKGGGFSAPIIEDGKVYLYYYVPAGRYYRKDAIEVARKMAEKLGEIGNVDTNEWRIDADDIIHCIDAETGWTIWKTVFEEQGLSYRAIGSGSEKTGAHLTPAIARTDNDIRCFALGTAGKVYCVDGRTGEPLWQSTIGIRAEVFEYLRRDAHRRGTGIPLNRDLGSCVIPAADVVVCNNHIEYQGGQRIVGNGMIALDSRTGKKRWWIDECLGWFGTPVRWSYGGKDYVIGVGTRAVCVEASTGKILWEIEEVKHDNAPCIGDNYLVCNKSGEDGITAYKISPEKAVKAWSLPAGIAGDLCGMVIINRRLYAQASSGFSTRLYCIDLEKGKVLASAPLPGDTPSSLVGIGTRIFREWGSKNKEGLIMFNTTIDHFSQVGEPLRISYANSVTPSIAGSRLFVRGRNGIYCYELEKEKGVELDRRIEMFNLIFKKGDNDIVDYLLSTDLILAYGDCKTLESILQLFDRKEKVLWCKICEAMLKSGTAGEKMLVSKLVSMLNSTVNLSEVIDLFEILARDLKTFETRKEVIVALGNLLKTVDSSVQGKILKYISAFGPDAEIVSPIVEDLYIKGKLGSEAKTVLQRIRPSRPVITVEPDISGLDL